MTRSVPFALALVLLAWQASPAVSQTPPATGQPQIDALMQRLIANDHVPALLDPDMPADQRAKQLALVPSTYELTLTPDGSLEVNGTTATLSVSVSLDTSNGTVTHSLENKTHLDFALRNGQWYFANFNFLASSPLKVVLIAVLILGGLYVVGFLSALSIARKSKPGGLEACDYRRALDPRSWKGVIRKTK